MLNLLLTGLYCLVFLSSAAPATLPNDSESSTVPEVLTPRCGQIIYPSLETSVRSNNPDIPMGNLATQQYFVWNYYSNPIEHDSLVEFTGIPAGAWNCQLEWNLPANADLFSWGKTQLNIYTVDRDATASDTWNN